MAAISRVTLRLLAAVLVVAGALTLTTSLATAATGPAGVAPITEYGAYPAGVLPVGCTAQGADLLVGEQFTVNGVSVGSLRELTVSNTDVIVMTWNSFAPGCEGAGLSLSVKIAPSADFDPGVDQYLAGFDYCGPGGPACNGNRLTLDLRAIGSATCFQVDANAGRPLEIVGPSGDYYSVNQPVNVLVSALNAGSEPCVVPPCATAPAGSGIPAESFACDPEVAPTTTSTTLAPAPTTTTEAPPAPRPTTPPTTAPCAAGQVRDANGQCVAVAAATTTTVRTCPSGQVLNTAGQCVATAPVVATNRTLPVTGGTTLPFTLVGIGLLGIGAVMLRVSARRPA
jgi:hypothetical protein